MIHCLVINGAIVRRGILWDGSSLVHLPPGGQLLPESECTGLPDAPPAPRKLMPATKLTLMRRLGSKWPLLKQVLAQMPETVRDAWELAQEIDPADGLFLEHRAALQTALGLSGDEFDQLFSPD